VKMDRGKKSVIWTCLRSWSGRRCKTAVGGGKGWGGKEVALQENRCGGETAAVDVGNDGTPACDRGGNKRERILKTASGE